MTGSEIRRRFLEHFASREHLVLPSAPLVPQGDPTTLFISAGMQPLQPYYRGLKEPPAPRLASSQKCLRPADLEEVGRTDRHCTFFEMLGNFAPTGAYFKEKAIPWAWELVRNGFGMPRERLRVTIHPTDDEAFEIWTRETEVPADWVYRNPDNWWGLELGPCGPDSEIWFDRGPGNGSGSPDSYPEHSERVLEFWNLVFPQFDRQPDGSLPALARPAIDTGMGLERMSAILQGVDTIFETDLMAPLVAFAADSAEPRQVSQRVVADHLRAMTFIIGEGITPSNEGRGYVLRRIIRRAVLHARRTRMSPSVAEGTGLVVDLMRDQYPELHDRREEIATVVEAESARFDRTLQQGMELFTKLAARHSEVIPGEEAFMLHDTYGFPIDLTRELAEERSLVVDMEGFRRAMEAQRARSRTTFKSRWEDVKDAPKSEFVGYSRLEAQASVVALRVGGAPAQEAEEGDAVEVFLDRTPFYGEAGGQVGDTGVITSDEGRVRVEDTQRLADDVIVHVGTVAVGRLRVGDPVEAAVDATRRHEIARHHTATHLLHRALREVLGEQILQQGSWVGPDHTTFDIPLDRPMTRDEIERVTHRINEQVRAALPFRESRRRYADAVASGAMHLFDEKYGDVVRVVCFGDWTCELCGGTHVASTADVGFAVVVSESSVGAGLRRIDLVAGEAAERLILKRLFELGDLARSLGGSPDEVPARVEELRAELKQARREIERLGDELRLARVRGAAQGSGAPPDLAVLENGVPVMVVQVEARDMDDLRAYADRYFETMDRPGVLVAASPAISAYVIKVARDLAGSIDANRLKAPLGPGGGRPTLVQGKLEGKVPMAAELGALLA